LADSYRALDPELLLWVQATLVVTGARAYRHWVAPLTETELERFWQEARQVGVRLGIPLSLSPATWPDLITYWQRMLAPDGAIQVTPTARRLSRLIVRPPLPLTPGSVVDLLALPGLALLPERLRHDFGIRWDARRDLGARASSAALRSWVRLVPRSWRQMPQARAAYRRIGRG
jgi:uncharacterized protein (DUF2236 family)